MDNYKPSFICAVMLLAAGCAAALPPHQVESRKNAAKPWTAYEAVSVDRIHGFEPKSDPSLDEYGGWQGTRVGNPDGFFRVRKIDGRWWMVDPAGNLFLAKSVASFVPGGSARQRAKMKEKFGSTAGWATAEIKKAGREAEFFKDVKEGGSSYGFPFVFFPEFEKTAERVIAPVAKHANDPYLIGYFLDNEIQFRRSMLWKCLTAWPKGHPNQRAAQAWLDARKGRAGCTMRDVTEEDRLEFVAHCVDVYLGTVTRILRKYDKNHMFLGSRFHLWDFPTRPARAGSCTRRTNVASSTRTS